MGASGSNSILVSQPSERRNLLLLWIAQFISKAGDQLFVAAGMFLVLSMAPAAGLEGERLAGWMGAAQALPALTLGLFAGALVDRRNRCTLMILSDVVRAALLLSLLALFHLGVLSWWMLPLTGFLLASASIVFEPARDAFIPEIVPKERLHRANALFQTSMPLAVVAGFALLVLAGDGGGHSDTHDTAGHSRMVWLIAADGLSFLVSAALIFAIRRPNAAAPIGQRPRTTHQLREFFQLVRTDSRLRALFLITAANNFFLMGPATVGAAILVQRDLGRDVSAFGALEGCMMLGLFAGLLWVIKFGRRFGKGKLLIFGLILDGITYVPFLWLTADTPFWVYLALIAFHGLFIPWIVVSRTSIVQEYWPNALHGRIFAGVAMTVTGATALSTLATGELARHFTSWELYALGGGGAALVGVLALLSKPLRSTQ